MMKFSDRIYDLAKHLDSKKAEEIVLIDVSAVTVVADTFIILSGTSTPHVKKLADEAEEFMAKRGEFKLRTEGYQEGKWIVLDYGDLLIHIFGRDERKYYNIERLWRDPLNSEDYIYGGEKTNE